jgi:hypothetical protein
MVTNYSLVLLLKRETKRERKGQRRRGKGERREWRGGDGRRTEERSQIS